VVRIQRITTADWLYGQECALREEVLLRPIGYDLARLRREFPGVEERLEHFVAVTNHHGRERVIGCAALLPEEPRARAGRITQMAVDPQRQGEGIGRRLVVAVESRAFGELGLNELCCHAPVAAMGFFEALGWEVDSEQFVEAGLPHVRMAIRQPEEAEGAE
jgi:N-acetylglutamate synthase-like GNAT family acetyltransferase